MHILITGGTGSIGRRLIPHLFKSGHTVTVVGRRAYRPASLPAKLGYAQWDAKTAEGWGELLESVDAVVNLAGAGLADEKWTADRKAVIKQSRVDAGVAITAAFEAATNKPSVLIQSSAIAYYGASQQDHVYTEISESGNDYLADVCKAWETSTDAVEEMGVRRAVIRTGIVLDPHGGAFPKMVMPFNFGAGGSLGSGRQWYSWIHWWDEVDAIRFLIETEAASGTFNLTSPNPVQQRVLAKAMGKALSRPSFAPTPGFVMKAMFGEMSTVLLDGQRVLPTRLLEAGYEFRFADVDAALADLVGDMKRKIHPDSYLTPTHAVQM